MQRTTLITAMALAGLLTGGPAFAQESMESSQGGSYSSTGSERDQQNLGVTGSNSQQQQRDRSRMGASGTSSSRGALGQTEEERMQQEKEAQQRRQQQQHSGTRSGSFGTQGSTGSSTQSGGVGGSQGGGM